VNKWKTDKNKSNNNSDLPHTKSVPTPIRPTEGSGDHKQVLSSVISTNGPKTRSAAINAPTPPRVSSYIYDPGYLKSSNDEDDNFSENGNSKFHDHGPKKTLNPFANFDSQTTKNSTPILPEENSPNIYMSRRDIFPIMNQGRNDNRAKDLFVKPSVVPTKDNIIGKEKTPVSPKVFRRKYIVSEEKARDHASF